MLNTGLTFAKQTRDILAPVSGGSPEANTPKEETAMIRATLVLLILLALAAGVTVWSRSRTGD